MNKTMIILRYAGYTAFFLLMFVLGLYVTFPWQIAKDRVLTFASKQSGMTITAASLHPSPLTGVRAVNVQITPAGAREPIVLDRIDASAKILAFITGKQGVAVSLPIAKGNVDADVVLDSDLTELEAKAESIELGLIPGFVEATGLPLTGSIDLETDLVISQKDSKLTNGKLNLKVKNLRIEKGGKIKGFPVPELAIGDADWTIPVEAGKATLKNLKLAGESVELILDGTITVMWPLARGQTNMTLSFKPTEKLLQSEPLLGALLNNIQQAKGGDGFYTYAVMGSLKAPRFTPKKK